MKKIYEGASALTCLLFISMVVLGFLFTTNSERESRKQRHGENKKTEKQEKRREEIKKECADQIKKEREEIIRQANKQIDNEKKRKDELHADDHATIEGWECYYQSLVEYNLDKEGFKMLPAIPQTKKYVEPN